VRAMNVSRLVVVLFLLRSLVTLAAFAVMLWAIGGFGAGNSASRRAQDALDTAAGTERALAAADRALQGYELTGARS
jgi:CHASE3 domain sensor protein